MTTPTDPTSRPAWNPDVGGYGVSGQPTATGPVGPAYAGWPPPSAPPKKRHRLRNWVLVGGGLVAVGVVATAGGAKDNPAPAAAASSAVRTPSTAAARTGTETTAEAPSPAAYTPRKTDFTLRVKVITKECFGSAGCNVEYRVDFAKIADRVPADASLEVTYTVTGGDYGDDVGTISVASGKYDPVQGSTSTASSHSVLKAKVTDVSETR